MARGQSSDNGTSDGTDVDGATATATQLTPEEQAKLDAKREARKQRRAQRSYVLVPMPAAMKTKVDEDAKAASKPNGVYLRDLLAGQWGIEIPVTTTTRRQKYASDEERDAAKKARRESRSNTMKGLMAAFNQLTKSGLAPEQATALAGAVVATGKPLEQVAAEMGITLEPAAA